MSLNFEIAATNLSHVSKNSIPTGNGLTIWMGAMAKKTPKGSGAKFKHFVCLKYDIAGPDESLSVDDAVDEDPGDRHTTILHTNRQTLGKRTTGMVTIKF